MAIIIPPLDKIERFKQPATDGELFFLEKIRNAFDDDVKIYFNPYFNGDRPDIVIIHPKRGVIVVEVKDWNLKSYQIKDSKTWIVKSIDQPVKSPHAQAFSYKKNIFDIHVNGLLEKKLKNDSFFKIISVYVFFYSETKLSLSSFFSDSIEYFKIKEKELNELMKDKKISFSEYERKIGYYSRKRRNFERDLRLSIGKDQIEKIKFPFSSDSIIFPDGVYEEFIRLLSPPFHSLEHGKKILYSKKQLRLCESKASQKQKISGIAGSGKTTVLAKKAVNAFVRHGSPILILTYNLTLRMFIKDKISEVRENFPWSTFEILNYHQFMSIALNNAGINIEAPEDISKNEKALDTFLENNYFSNLDILEGMVIKNKYETILIDEVQDYKPEWIKLVRKYFLHEAGEMALFGDEKQNLYKREIDTEKKITVPNGFGRWEKLTKSYRYKDSSKILSLSHDFQLAFLSELYELDEDESKQDSFILVGVNAFKDYKKSTVIDNNGFNLLAAEIAADIVSIARMNSIHPNDIVILSSHIDIAREIDFVLRRGENKEKTLTTFETKEMYIHENYTKEKKAIRKAKKFRFNLNSGVMKISTIHSFKGFESPTVCILVDREDSPELVYTALTRVRQNIILFCEEGSQYSSFFSERLAPLSSFYKN